MKKTLLAAAMVLGTAGCGGSEGKEDSQPVEVSSVDDLADLTIGVQIGTCLLVANECPIHENYKDAVIKAKDTDTVVTGRSVNTPVRILKNQMAREYLKLEGHFESREELEKLTLGALRKAVQSGDVKTGSVMMGQIAGMVKEKKPMQQILDEMMASTKQVYANLQKVMEEMQ